MRPQDRRPGYEAGLHLQAEIDRDQVRIERAARIPRVSRVRLRSPLLTAERAGMFPTSLPERVLTVLGREGEILDAFGWSAAGDAFFDRETEEEDGGLRGSPGPSRQTTEVLRVPVKEGATFLFFYSVEARRRADGVSGLELDRRPLGLYYLGSGDLLPVPPLPIPWPSPPGPLPLPLPPPITWRPPREPFGRHLDPARWRILPHGYIQNAQTIVSTGSPADQFDIVILGDGFQESELGIFDARVALIAGGLLTMPPFDGLAGRINIHSVRVVSTDSGITNCPSAGGTRQTFFNVEGNFNGQYAGFVGTHTPQVIYQAAELIAPREQLELFLVIANCSLPGGSAFPEQDLAFVTMWPLAPDPMKFVNIAAHEAAHVIANLGEEYIGCEPPDPCKTYPNQITEAQKQADDVWWKSLALPAELQNNAFRAVHAFGDPFDANNEPIVPSTVAGMLGLYWGCQDIDPAIPPQGGTCDPYQDPRGAPFHRGMARCKMRKSFFPFCRVCSLMLEDAIADVTP